MERGSVHFREEETNWKDLEGEPVTTICEERRSSLLEGDRFTVLGKASRGEGCDHHFGEGSDRKGFEPRENHFVGGKKDIAHRLKSRRLWGRERNGGGGAASRESDLLLVLGGSIHRGEGDGLAARQREGRGKETC